MGNTLRESAPGEFGGVRLVAGTIGFAQTSVTLDTLEADDVVISCWAQVLTAFNAGTTNVLIAGNGVSTNKFLAAADVTEGTPGVYPAGGAGPFTAETVAGSLVVAYAQTGTAATTGSARVYALVTSAAV